MWIDEKRHAAARLCARTESRSALLQKRQISVEKKAGEKFVPPAGRGASPKFIAVLNEQR